MGCICALLAVCEPVHVRLLECEEERYIHVGLVEGGDKVSGHTYSVTTWMLSHMMMNVHGESFSMLCLIEN